MQAINVIAIADDDSLVGKLESPKAELLISLGDLWDSTIERAQSAYGCSTVFAVKGNHDSAAQFNGEITDLHYNIAEFGGRTFGGFKGSWKYKPKGHHLFEQDEVERKLRQFPAVDVFVAHNSPAGFHERDYETHQGFRGFTDYIERVQPAYFIHGHQHMTATSVVGATTIISVFGESEITLSFDI